MFGVSLQRKPPGAVELNGTVWFNGTVTMVVEKGKVTPPSVERAAMTLLGALIGLKPPQQAPRCQAATTWPLGRIASDGYSLWLVPVANSLDCTRALTGVQVTPPSSLPRTAIEM